MKKFKIQKTKQKIKKKKKKELETQISEYEKRLEELKSKHQNEDLTKEPPPFVLAKGAAKALTLLNEDIYFKLFEKNEYPISDIILIYRIYFQLLNKEKDIINTKNDNDKKKEKEEEEEKKEDDEEEEGTKKGKELETKISEYEKRLEELNQNIKMKI